MGTVSIKLVVPDQSLLSEKIYMSNIRDNELRVDSTCLHTSCPLLRVDTISSVVG